MPNLMQPPLPDLLDSSNPPPLASQSDNSNISRSQQQRNHHLSTQSTPGIRNTSSGEDSSKIKPTSPGNQTLPSQYEYSIGGMASANTSMAPPVPLVNSWSWGEQLFFSQDDEDITVVDSESDGNISRRSKTFLGGITARKKPLHSVRIDPGTIELGGISQPPPSQEGDDDDDDATCNNTVIEKVRQRGKKASRASTVGAFVTFLKALFGIGMLSNPAVLGEVGLVLGTFCHFLIVVGCAFACYLLLAARQMAMMEVMTKQRRDAEKREEYEMWKAEAANRAAMQQQEQRSKDPSTLLATKTPSVMSNSHSYERTQGEEDDNDEAAAAVQNSERTLQVTNTVSGIVSEEWTVSPVPLHRVHTSGMVIPKQGWGRCEDAIHNVSGRSPEASKVNSSYTATPSCGNVQMIRQKSRSVRGRSESVSKDKHVSDEYERFSDKVHNTYMMTTPMPPRPPPPPADSPRVRLVTYGDVAKYLAGKRASFFIIFTIVIVHLMFASGMVHLAVENLCYVVGWERLGWSYTYYAEGQDRHTMMRRLGSSEDSEDGASRSNDEEGYYLEWKGPDFTGRLAMAALLFPIIQGLLQIPSLTELATISTFGLLAYAFGCIGSMLYTALVLTDGHPFQDHPDDMWKSKWSGVPTYVATTIYCIEGINLALPTVGSIEGAPRWSGGGLTKQPSSGELRGGNGSSTKENEKRDLSVFIVVGAVFLYGMVTLVVSWIGLAGGLGGGIGTIHGEDGCWDVTYCLNSSAVRFVYMLSLGVALVLTLPVILYPSTEMLEVWLDERNDERRRKKEAAASASQRDTSPRAFWHVRQKSILPDDEETVYTVSDFSPRSELGLRNGEIEIQGVSSSNETGEYIAPEMHASGLPEPSPMAFHDNDSLLASPNATGSENVKLKAKRKVSALSIMH